MKNLSVACLVCVSSFLFNSSSHAALMGWDNVKNATGNVGDIVTDGSLFDAVTMFSSDLTVNGVDFTGNASFSGGAVTFGTSNISFSGVASTQNYGSPAPSSWDSGYRDLVNNGAWHANGFNMVINNLTLGEEYLVQIWNPYWDSNWKTDYCTGTSCSGDVNHGVGSSVISQYVTGSFIADSSTQTIFAAPGSNSYGLPSSIQVRSQVRSQVPEPSIIALFGLGLAGLGFSARRKKV
jgi:hypothetical protein